MTEITKSRFGDVPVGSTFYNIDVIPFVTLIKTSFSTGETVKGNEEVEFLLNDQVGIDLEDDENYDYEDDEN